MTKVELVSTIADRTGLSKRQAEEAIDATLKTVADTLSSGRSVGLPGLGTFTVKDTAARTGIKPGTSEKIQIPAGRKVSFKASTTLKGSI